MNPLAEWNQSRWNQLNDLEDLRHALGSLFSGSGVHRPKDDAGVPEWIPVVDVSEDARGYVLKAQLPQVKKDDVQISMEDGTLTITGVRKFAQNSKRDHPLPLACGRFVHCFAVPSDARPTRVTAVFVNEILTVHLARNEKARVRRAESEACLASTVQRTHHHRSSGAPGQAEHLAEPEYRERRAGKIERHDGLRPEIGAQHRDDGGPHKGDGACDRRRQEGRNLHLDRGNAGIVYWFLDRLFTHQTRSAAAWVTSTSIRPLWEEM